MSALASDKAHRRNYEEVLALVGQELSHWDPYALIEEGAPPDEFEAEAAALVPRLLRCESSEDSALAVFEVFSHAFGASDFTPARCRDVGARLHTQLVARGHIK